MDSSKFVPIFVYGILVLVLLMAACFFLLGARNVWRGLASPHWPKTSGVVTVSDTTSSTDVDSKTRIASTEYSANISFRYNVGGQAYTTSLLYFGQTLGSGDPSEAQLRHLRYPVGAEVSISYNHGNPAVAAAEPGFHSESLLLLIGGLGFALPCLMAGLTIASASSSGAGNSVMMPIVTGLFGSVFALLGIGALSLGLINLSRAHASEAWPKVPGVIAYQKLETSDSSGGPTYSTALVFSYDVAGKKCYSNLRRFGLLAAGSDEEADKVQAKYPQDQAVTVSYSPDNPNLAVLEPGIDQEAYILPGIGLALLAFATLVFVFIVPTVGSMGSGDPQKKVFPF